MTLGLIANRADIDIGYASRLLDFLSSEGLILREPRGPVEEVDWRKLLSRWADDYQLTKANKSVLYIDPRGLTRFTEVLRSAPFRYSSTGSLAAAQIAPVAPSRLGAVYVEERNEVADLLGLMPSDSGANVMLLTPRDPVVLEQTMERNGLRLAPLSQVVVDLMTSPGRGPAEAEALLNWMGQTRMTGGSNIAPIYVAARAALLDALEALGDQRRAVVLVGAQAIYLHTGEGEIAIAPFTTDGDLVIDPSKLERDPHLDTLMNAAGFSPGKQVGSWLSDRTVEGSPLIVPVDLLVPEAVSGKGRRAARIGDHGDRTARRARGLEGALVDNASHRIEALDPMDPRGFDILAAGPAALLVSKLHKIAERAAEPMAKRLKDKDSFDIFRLLQTTETAYLASRVELLRRHPLSGDVTNEAISHLDEMFSSASGLGIQMLRRTTAGLEDPQFIFRAATALASNLVNAVRR